MNALSALDAISSATVRVSAESRLRDVSGEIESIRATHAAVFDGQKLCGVVPLQKILFSSPERIFIDLIEKTPEPVVSQDTPVRAVASLMEGSGFDAVQVVDDCGEFAGIITQRSLLKTLLRETELQIREINRLKLQQERLCMLGQISSGVAHDLNNTLTAIVGYLDLMLIEENHEDIPDRYLHIAYEAAKDTSSAVKRLQSFYSAEDESAPLEKLDLTMLAGEARDLSRPKWSDDAARTGRRISIRIEGEESVPARGRPGELREVMTNLLFNAVDAMSSDGVISIKIRRKDSFAVMEVHDTGMGMTREQAKACFEPFYTTKGTSGTGLGLSVCAEIVERHDGFMEVESAPMQGSVFRVYLPLHDISTKTEEEKDEKRLNRWRILYIDDDERLLKVIQKMLQALGQEVDVCEDSGCLLDRFRSGNYDLIITDLSMPDVVGTEVIDAVRTINPDIKVMLLTGWARSALVESYPGRQKPDQVLEKPPTLKDLRQALALLQD